MLTDQQIEQAARLLVSRRRGASAGALLSQTCRPADVDDALRIQQAVLQQLNAEIGGWKCSVPPTGGAVLAPIPANVIFRTSPCVMPIVDGMAAIEPEIAYVMGQNLPPRETPYSCNEVLNAVASVHLAFELIETRYTPDTAPDMPDKLADSLSNYGLFLGPSIKDEHGKEGVDGASLPAIALVLNEGERASGSWEGKHPDGHPLRALHWLANYLAGRGTGLKRGEVVTTGSYHGLIQVPADTPLRMRFADLGNLDITIQTNHVP
jgi:2-keto-4-pentenoate hydratase